MVRPCIQRGDMLKRPKSHKFSVVYINNYVGEELARERNTGARSAAGEKKVMGLVRAMQTRGIPVAVVSPGWKKLKGTGNYVRPVVLRREGVPFFVASYLDVRILNWLVCLWSMVHQTIKAHRVLRGPKRILVYDRDLRRVLPALVARFLFGSFLYLELEAASEEGRDTLSFAKRTYFRVLKAMCDPFLSGALLASSTMRSRVGTRNIAICPGVFAGTPETQLPEWPRGRLRVLYGASFDSLRGIHLLIAAMRILENRYPAEAQKIIIVMCGQGRLSESIRGEMATFQHLQVELLGFISETEYAQQLGRAHVGLSLNPMNHPMSAYVFPSKVVELMSAGKVVIASGVSDVPRVAADRAIIYYEDKPEVIAQHIAAVARDFRRYELLGQRAARWCAQHYSYEAVGNQLEQLFS